MVMSIRVGTPHGGRVKFPATQVPSADPNTLDDYEEGTWTPVMAFGGASVDVTYTQRVGNYTKIGNICHLFGQMYLSSNGTSTGAATITGVPFTANTNNAYPAPVYLLQGITFANQAQAVILGGETQITFAEVTEAGTRTDLTEGDFADNARVEVSCTFII